MLLYLTRSKGSHFHSGTQLRMYICAALKLHKGYELRMHTFTHSLMHHIILYIWVR